MLLVGRWGWCTKGSKTDIKKRFCGVKMPERDRKGKIFLMTL
jgi:hypothetical protein